MRRRDAGPCYRIVADGVERGRAGMLAIALSGADLMPASATLEIVDPEAGPIMRRVPFGTWTVLPAGEEVVARAPIGGGTMPPPPTRRQQRYAQRYAWQDRADLR
jgi:hypothetical protein